MAGKLGRALMTYTGRSHDAKVASAPSTESQNRSVLLLTRCDGSTIGHHDVDAEDMVAARPYNGPRGECPPPNVASSEADSLPLSSSHNDTMRIRSFVKFVDKISIPNLYRRPCVRWGVVIFVELKFFQLVRPYW